MSDEVLELLTDLQQVITQENGILDEYPFDGLAIVVDAKARLTTRLEALLMRQNQETPMWLEQMDLPRKRQLRTRIEQLSAGTSLNERLLKRKIEQSGEMIAFVASEARRMANNRSSIYTSHGSIDRRDIATPLSVNTTS
jgi:flagellar biosynthesis/type III secretory pathway chaperone